MAGPESAASILRQSSELNPDGTYQWRYLLYSYISSLLITNESHSNLATKPTTVLPLKNKVKVVIRKERKLKAASSIRHQTERRLLFNTSLTKTVSNQKVAIYQFHHLFQMPSLDLSNGTRPIRMELNDHQGSNYY